MTEGQHTIDAREIKGLGELEVGDKFHEGGWDSRRQLRALLEKVEGIAVVSNPILEKIALESLGLRNLQLLNEKLDRTAVFSQDETKPEEDKMQARLLASSISDKISEIQEAEAVARRAEAASSTTSNEALNIQKEMLRLQQERDTKEQIEKNQQKERERISTLVDDVVKIYGEITEILDQINIIATECANTSLISDSTLIKNEADGIRNIATTSRISSLNGGDINKVKTSVEKCNDSIKTLKTKTETLRGKAETVKKNTEITRSIEKSKQEVVGIENIIVFLNTTVQEVKTLTDTTLKIAREIKSIPAVISEIQSIGNTTSFQTEIGNLKPLLDKIKEDINKAINMSDTQIFERVRKAEDIKNRIDQRKQEAEDIKNRIDQRKQEAEDIHNRIAKEKEALLNREKEKQTWIDYEYQQRDIEKEIKDNQNKRPDFYSRLSEEEKKVYDFEWELCNASFYKQHNSGNAESMGKNENLIHFTNEKMEALYSVEGVKKALEWYAKVLFQNDVNVSRIGSIYECTSQTDFEQFRKALRDYLETSVFNINPTTKATMTEIDRMKLENDVKRADAIAWNWMWCANVVESMDSRYSISGKRHDKLPTELCSDELRAFFHPQEKYEDKTKGNLSYGIYGTWGTTQVDRIAEECGINPEDKEERSKKLVLVPAPNKDSFWLYTIMADGKVEIYVPECNPTTLMQSFFEVYVNNGGTTAEMSLKDALLGGHKIDWTKILNRPWQTNYLTVRFVEAKQIKEFFTKYEERPEGWTDWLNDRFLRLNLREIMGNKFHNFKIWAYFAQHNRGKGVINERRRDFTSIFSHHLDKSNRLDGLSKKVEVEKLLRKSRFLSPGEKLDLE